MRFLIKYKILLIGFVGIIGLLINITYNYYTGASSRESLSNISNIHIPLVDHINGSILQLKEIKALLQMAASTGEIELLEKATTLRPSISENLQKISNIDASYKNDVDIYINKFDKYMDLSIKISTILINRDYQNINQQQIEEMNKTYDSLLENLIGSRAELNDRFSNVVTAAWNSTKKSALINLIIALISSTIIFITALLNSKSITNTIHRVNQNMYRLSERDIDFESRIDKASNDEMGDLVISFNTFVERMRSVFIKIQDEKWLKSGIAELNLRMRGERDVADFGNRVLKFLSEYIEVRAGCLYVNSDITEENQNTFNLVANHALSKKCGIEDQFIKGEGVIGQVVVDKEILTLYDIKEESLSIETGISQSAPYSITILPLTFEDNVIGVMEIAFLESMDRKQLSFIEAATEPIGQSLNMVKSRIHTESLLKTTQSQSIELKKQQKQLVESEKMSSLGGLVAGVAHEINTPVGISVTASSHLEKKTGDFSDLYDSGKISKKDLKSYIDTATESTKIILSNLSRAAELIQSFKQVAVDQSSEERRKFNLKEYIEEILSSLKPKFKGTAHKVITNCPADIMVNSYPGALCQVMTNLLMNTLQHGFEETKEGQINIDVSKADENVKILYKDSGCGISDENIKKIFDPFFTTKRGQGGSGLGMNIVYNLTTQTLGGTIKCDSQIGEWTKMEIEFPLKMQE